MRRFVEVSCQHRIALSVAFALNAIAVAPASGTDMPAVTFEDRVSETGINFRHHANPTDAKYMLEAMSGGVAVIDFDNDLFLDLGLNPTTLSQGLLGEVTNIAKKYAHRADLEKIPCTSIWTRDQKWR